MKCKEVFVFQMSVLKNTFFLQVAELLEQTHGHFGGGGHMLVFTWGKSTLLGLQFMENRHTKFCTFD